MTSHDPEKVVREVFARLSSRDFDGMAELLADDIEFDLAFAPAALPMPTRGRSAVHRLVADIIGGMFDPMTLEVTTTYPCADPAMLVVEYASEGVVTHNGNRYANRYVGIFRVDDGRLGFWREYHNPEAATRALG
ncbi:MAG TPA: nuclear transport factor 2 family protein [Acidimicrobiia bacterium]